MDYISFYSNHVKDLRREGKQYMGWCPFHADEGTAHKGFSVNPSNGLWKCHGSCNKGGSVLDFCELKKIPKKEAPGYDPKYRRYSYQDGAVKKKSPDKVFWEIPQKQKTPYNVEAIDEARTAGKRLWICEGEPDTETMIRAGELAIGIPSASDLGGIENIDKPLFREIEKITLAFDNDDAGKKAIEKVLALIPWADVIRWPDDKKPGYDVTDCYNEGGAEGFLETLTIWTEPLPDDPPLTDYLSKKFDESQTREPDVPLGYRLTRFKRLQENIDGIQPGLYIIGADTNVGKTSFALNLYLDLLNTNTDLRGIYFSLDDNQDIIINRLLSLQSQIPINHIQKKIYDERKLGRLRRAYESLKDLSQKGRLFIYDQSRITHIDHVEKYIKRRLNKKLFVVIDGLFNLDVDIEEKADSGIRGLNIARANALKRLTDVYKIPVICTAELRKKDAQASAKMKPPTVDDIMETGKFKYNANLILLIYPEGMNFDAYDTQDEPTLEIKYAKNKLSHYRGTDTVTFYRSWSEVSYEKAKSKNDFS